jgi:hypothetical protein
MDEEHADEEEDDRQGDGDWRVLKGRLFDVNREFDGEPAEERGEFDDGLNSTLEVCFKESPMPPPPQRALLKVVSIKDSCNL